MTIATLIDVTTILRETHPDMKRIFTEGGCYELFRVLNRIEPRVEPFYDGGHVYTRLGNTLIDITGERSPRDLATPVYCLDDEPRILGEAPGWKEAFWK